MPARSTSLPVAVVLFVVACARFGSGDLNDDAGRSDGGAGLQDSGDSAVDGGDRDASVLDRGAYPGAVWWEVDKGGTGHGYLLIAGASPLTWEAARKAAMEVPRGHLVVFDDLTEYRFVASEVAKKTELYDTVQTEIGPWVGLLRSGRAPMELSWVTGVPFVYDDTMWNVGEPNNGNGGGLENWGALVGRADPKLNDAPASDPIRGYVVEIE